MRERVFVLAGVLAVLSLAGTTGAASAKLGDCGDRAADPASVSKKRIKTAVLCLLNEERRQRGLRRLVVDEEQRRAAARHNRLMVRQNCFAHRCSGEPDLVARLTRAGYLPCRCLWEVGENIAWGTGRQSTPGSTARRWMNSPPHRHNILNPDFRHIGIAVHTGTPIAGLFGGATYTTDFGVRR